MQLAMCSLAIFMSACAAAGNKSGSRFAKVIRPRTWGSSPVTSLMTFRIILSEAGIPASSFL